jgi:two-component system sensor histidine kinase BaeS
LQAEVGTLTKLVDDLHQLSMSDEGALAYQKAPVDVINILEVASGAFRERFASRNLKIDLSCRTAPCLATGSPDAVVQ